MPIRRFGIVLGALASVAAVGLAARAAVGGAHPAAPLPATRFGVLQAGRGGTEAEIHG